MSRVEPLSISGLAARYARGETTPEQVVAEVERRIAARGPSDAVWIERFGPDGSAAQLRALAERRARGDVLPLYGVPFAVKDNIDAAGLPTTAGCPAYAYRPTKHATVVARLIDAGAVLVGKTNLDQFATGLNGTRSPHGAPRCVFHEDYVSGGSSSGSAVAVAAGLVAFALGTDTAGSGRIPAAFNDIVGLKPTRGRVSNRGVIPACRSLDCVSIFAHSCADAEAVLAVLEGPDAADPYSRAVPAAAPAPRSGAFRFGVPAASQLRFFGDVESEALYRAALARLSQLGGEAVEIDLEPFLDAGALLYGGPWVAERDAAVGEFLRANPSAVHPVVRSIILGSASHSAADAFRAMYRLEELRSRAAPVWERVDVLALPTAGTIYTVSEVLAEPWALNANLGWYTTFMNMLDLCGVAVPAGFRANRTPFGISLVAPAFTDALVCALGARYEAVYRGVVRAAPAAGRVAGPSAVRLAVVGAHLTGQPLNHQLTGRNARCVKTCRTAPAYRLYALAGTVPPKPGLVHVGDGGAAIEIEVWELTPDEFGSFVSEVPSPLAIGTLEIEGGETVKGFVCEPRALAGATDITHFGGWRAFRAAKPAASPK